MINFTGVTRLATRHRISFSGKKIALIVRGKTSEKHELDLLSQHADVILPYGQFIGFFGTEAGKSGQELGFNLSGVVWNADEMIAIGQRPYYANLDMAKTANVISTVLLIDVTSKQSAKFEQYWEKLRKNPGEFNIVGENCSTRASSAFEFSGLVRKSIPGLDTPNNLYNQLVTRHNGTSISGYIGLVLKKTEPPFRFHYDLVIEELVK